jgi:succinoglycan biosynthesis transport protein ExoP
MTSPSETDAISVSPAISLGDVLKGVARRKLMIAATTIAGLGIGLGLVTILKPTYSTEAQVLIENLETPFDRVQGSDATMTGNAVDDRVVTSQMSVIKSEDLGRRVVAALKLETDPEFNPLLKGLSASRRIKLALGFGDDPRLQSPEQRALATYLDDLAVYQIPGSNVIAIKYTAARPATAAKVANTLADVYVMATRENQSAPTERARQWLASQIDALRNKLAHSEQAVEEFRSKAGLLQGATTTLGTQQVSELTSQITVAQTASAEAKARADAIRRLVAQKGAIDSSSEVQASVIIQRLKEQRTEAQRVLADLQAVYLPGHPKMIAAEAQIANIDKQIRVEALKVAAGLEDQARIAQARQASLQATLDSLKGKESSANLDDVKLKALERDAAADRALLETMLSRYAEASSRQDATAQPGLARVIQSADVPAVPTFPKRGPLTLLITLAGFALGLGLAFLLEIMAAATRIGQRLDAVSTVRAGAASVPAVSVASPSTVAEPAALAVPKSQRETPAVPEVLDPLATLPHVASASEAAYELDAPEVASAARVMADWCRKARQDNGIKRFAITSLGDSEGDGSLACVVLARALARRSRVIVVDVARAGSLLEGLTGIASGPGILDLITGAAGFTKVIGRDAKSAAHLLRFGIDRSPEALARLDERLDTVLAALEPSYDAVIVHAGEVSDETPAVLHKCRGALVLAPAARFADATALVEGLLMSGLAAARHVLIGPPSTQAATAEPTPRAATA